MDHATMADPLHISRQEQDYEGRSASTRSGSQTSTDSPRPQLPMAIPSLRYDDAPPPLPPPRYNDDLAHGIDLSWKWANREEFGVHRKLAPIKQGSSLFGGYLTTGRSGSDDDEAVDAMDLDEDYDRKGSASTIRSPSQAEIDTASLAVGRIQRLTRAPPSPLASSNQRLHGERPLAQESLSRSSHAYDKHLLSKIGKPSSPPRRPKSESEDSAAVLGQRRLVTARDAGLSPLSVTDISAVSVDPMSPWAMSPSNSAGVSPAHRPAWRENGMGYRSPSVDDLAPPSVVDRDFYPRLRGAPAITPAGLLPGSENSHGHGTLSNRGNYTQTIFAEPETHISIEENGTFRKLSLGDSRLSHMESRESFSGHGMKRRALSPPTDAARDDKLPAHAGEPQQRITSVNYAARSPNTQFLKCGSVSSTTSSTRQETLSYTSSVPLSATGSSMTSISSFERHSPGGLSPTIESAQDSPYVAPVGTKPILSITTSKRPLDRTSYESRAPHNSSKMSNQPPADDNRPPAASRLSGHYICECCPKKPKKFDTENELKLHEMEKQYTCQFCHNRFKNKNEAERHQNSLHLRRHSWSCAAISGYEAAFHPSTSQTTNGPASDACGYCGEEFPNHPRPDWDRRVEHLINVHKFGECNQSKKFFRADHFRQHLKHSHAGRSGKWTNMLESACMKEEPLVESGLSTSSPTEQSAGGSTGEAS